MSRKKSAENNEAARQESSEDMTRYRILTDRMPYWKGKPQPRNAVIEGSEADPAILAMLERGWIKAV